jgi:acetylornithine deacetylase/succinyl-diaminopimelate desuccinylase-like protein
MYNYIDKLWDESALPALKEFVSIPALSPEFDAEWEKNGYLLDSLELAEAWVKAQDLKNCKMQIVKADGKTPVLIINVEGDADSRTLFYGHFDKQPESDGWDENKAPWTPVVENDRLYGRGSADDGYALFSAVIAIKSLQESGEKHGDFVILIETCEESGSFDLDYYLEECSDLLGEPDLVICLDSGAKDYENFWITSSLRGLVSGELSVSLVTRDIHSGESGRIASSFRVMRQLIDRVEDAQTGEVLIPEFNVDIPQNRLTEIDQLAELVGDDMMQSLPLIGGVSPVSKNPSDIIANSSWRATLSYIGAGGFSDLANAGNIIRKNSTMLLSFRTPPSVDVDKAGEALKTTLLSDAPYDAKVELNNMVCASGWNMPDMDGELLSKVESACAEIFDGKPCYAGQGGSIPLIATLAERFEGAKFIVTGAMGPDSNAHGPNECLHIPYVKKLTYLVAKIIGA